MKHLIDFSLDIFHSTHKTQENIVFTCVCARAGGRFFIDLRVSILSVINKTEGVVKFY